MTTMFGKSKNREESLHELILHAIYCINTVRLTTVKALTALLTVLVDQIFSKWFQWYTRQ